MQLPSLLVGALLALGIHAAPVTDGTDQSPASDGNSLFQRDSGQLCRILYSTHVNCRTGPGTNYRSVVGLNKEWTRGYWFTCVKSGECITLNGAVNWYVYTTLLLLCYRFGWGLIGVVGGIISRRMGAMLTGIIRMGLVLWVCLPYLWSGWYSC
jgi:hypothetical protein